MENIRRIKILEGWVRDQEMLRARIDSGIELSRKSSVKIKVTDAAGKPIPGAKITLKQKTHDFKYGANIFLLDELPDEERNAEHRRIFAESFNLATVPFYWDTLEPVKGQPRYGKDSPKVYRRPAIDLCLEYCRENGIEPKAHCLVYDKFRPKWVPMDEQGARDAYLARMENLAEHYADKINMWEVTNETLFPINHNCTNSMFYMAKDHVEWSFAQAERLFPKNRLIINETQDNIFEMNFGTRSPYYMQIDRLLRDGTRIDGIGMQYHSFFKKELEESYIPTRYAPQFLLEVFDLYARFDKPMQITEMTIPCYDEGEAGQDLQAEILKCVYSMWFSMPLMEAIVYWNVADGYTYVDPNSDWNENYYAGGLLNHDLSLKPAMQMIQTLFGKTWRTNLQTETGADGSAWVRGFHGHYDVEITAGGTTQTVPLHIAKNGPKDCALVVK